MTRDVATFTLANGTFKFTSRRGELAGTYVGLVTAPTPLGCATAAMTLQVTRGSGELTGATGTLVGEGSGGFTTGGDFKLKLTGDVRTSAKLSAPQFTRRLQGSDVAVHVQRQQSPYLETARRGNDPTMARFAMEFAARSSRLICL